MSSEDTINLHKYDMVQMLGRGTFGEAWLVVHQESDKKFVIKQINVFRIHKRQRDQALSEVEILAKLRHINIIKYKDSFVAEHQLNIVMEYADSGDMHDKIVQQNGVHFREEDIIDWFIQIMFALRYIHSRHILHRDLKTQNIFLTSKNVIKLGDFGIAKVLQDTTDMAVTTIGTPYYMSPEICRQQSYSYKSDIWAAGCVLYEMCHLEVAFKAANLAALVMKILSGKYEPLPHSYSSILDDLINALLSIEPPDRPSMNQLICIPFLQPYVDRYISRCRLIIHGNGMDRNVIVNQLKSPAGAERPLAPMPLPDAPQLIITGPTPERRISTGDIECRAPKARRLSHTRSLSTNEEPPKQTKSPKFSIYRDVLRRRVFAAARNAHQRRNHKNVPKSVTDPNNNVNIRNNATPVNNSGLYKGGNSPVNNDAVPVVNLCRNNLDSKPLRFTYDVPKPSLNYLKNIVEKQKTDFCSVAASKNCNNSVNSHITQKEQIRIQNYVNEVLFEAMKQSSRSIHIAMTTIVGHLNKEIGHNRVQKIKHILSSAAKTGLDIKDTFAKLTAHEILYFPLIQQVMMLENLRDIQ